MKMRGCWRRVVCGGGDVGLGRELGE